MESKLKLYNGVQELLKSGYFEIIIEEAYEELNDDNLIDTVFGHTLSRTSFSLFENAVASQDEDQREDFRSYINKLMFEKNISQIELARKSMIVESTLSRYINGSRKIQVNIAMRMILALTLNFEEAKLFIRKIGKSFQKTKRDAVIIEAITQETYDVFLVEAVIRKLTDQNESLFSERELSQMESLGVDGEEWEIEIID